MAVRETKSRAFIVRTTDRDLKSYNKKARAHGYRQLSPFVRRLLDEAPEQPAPLARAKTDAAA